MSKTTTKTKRPTLAELGATYGLSRSGMDNARTKGIDVYDPAAMLSYLEERERTGKPDTTAAAKPYHEARTKLVLLQCEKIKLAIDKDRGELIERDTFNAIMHTLGLHSRGAWDRIPDDLPPMLEGLTAAQMKAKLLDYKHAKQVELSEGVGLDR